MTRPICRRRGGALPVTAGFLGIGVSATLLVMVGSRALSQEAFSGLFVAWTVATVFGFGVGTPTEQVISRRLNVGAPDPVRGSMRLLRVAALIAAAVSTVLALTSASGRAFGLLGPTAVLAIVGWVAVVEVRSRLAGAGDLVAYGIVLGAEALLRVLLLVAGAVFREAAGPLLAASVAVPLLVAAAVGLVFAVPDRPVPDREPEDAAAIPAGEHQSFVVVSVGYQVCLQAAVLLLGWRTGSDRQAVVGAFGAANSYFRSPTVVMGGITTHALVALSHAWGAADPARFSAELRRAVRNIAVVGLGGSLLALAASPVVLPLYYPHALGLPPYVIGALVLSTVLASFGSVMIQPLLAAGRVRGAALAWGLGGLLTIALFAMSSGTDVLASLGLVAGPLTALVVALVELRRLSAGAGTRPRDGGEPRTVTTSSSTPPLG
jgi:O-antigen/teichoic acid export membrane protein